MKPNVAVRSEGHNDAGPVDLVVRSERIDPQREEDLVMTVQPLNNAIFVGVVLGLQPRDLAAELADVGTLIERASQSSADHWALASESLGRTRRRLKFPTYVSQCS